MVELTAGANASVDSSLQRAALPPEEAAQQTHREQMRAAATEGNTDQLFHAKALASAAKPDRAPGQGWWWVGA